MPQCRVKRKEGQSRLAFFSFKKGGLDYITTGKIKNMMNSKPQVKAR